MPSNQLACRFGNLYASATYLSERSIACLSPGPAMAGAVHLQVTVDGDSYSSMFVEYVYLQLLGLEYIMPQNGPPAGGTVLMVHTEQDLGLTRELKCKFGNITVPAIRASNTQLNCTSPMHAAGLVSFEVSENGYDFTRSNQTFLYQSQVTVDSVLPNVIPSGAPVAFRIVGTNFLPGSGCALNDVTSSYTTWISANEMVCTFDSLDSVSNANVRVSSNMQDFTSSTSNLRVASQWGVQRIDPDQGPPNGGTLVQVYGNGFVQGDMLVCKFGSLPSDRATAARWLSEGQIECRSPNRGGTSGNVTLEVSINNQDFSTNAVMFEYLGQPAVGGIRPGTGPLGGGTLVQITGGPFSQRAASLGTIYCRFGSVETNAVSKAQRVDSTTVECISPAHVAGEVPVEVSMNGLDYTDAGVSFAYLALSLHRCIRNGPQYGGTLVQITARTWSAAPTVLPLWQPRRVAGCVVSATRMDCTTPPMTTGATTLSLLAMVLATRRCRRGRLSTWRQSSSIGLHLLGPVAGGSTVTLTGIHFQLALRACRTCRVASTSRRLRLVS